MAHQLYFAVHRTQAQTVGVVAEVLRQCHSTSASRVDWYTLSAGHLLLRRIEVEGDATEGILIVLGIGRHMHGLHTPVS